MQETEQKRHDRHRKRATFDAVARLYDEVRVGYPDDIVDWVMSTAEVGKGSSALEIGCGTGQLTRQLAERGLRVTAIDLAPSMVDVARSHVETQGVEFHATAFENFDEKDASFDLVVSATAHHWVDPEVMWSKSARLLRNGAWLAVLGTGEVYDDPVGSALMDLWIRLSDDGGAWASQKEKEPTLPEVIASAGLFEPAVERRHTERRSIAASVITGLEHTRATVLAHDEATRDNFSRGLERLLQGVTHVGLKQESAATMARLAGG